MKQITQWSVRMAVVGSVVGVTLGALSARVEATSRRYTGSMCQPQYADLALTHYTTDNEFGLVNEATSVINVTCPLMDNTSVPNTSTSKLTLVEVHGEDNNNDVGSAGAIIARVCARSAGGPGVNCGNPRSSHDADIDTDGNRIGGVKLTMGPSYLTKLGTTGNIIYVWVQMPANDGGSQSKLRTVYASN
jgi:hypothetical protein